MINENRLTYYSFDKEEILYKLLEARLSKHGRECDNCKKKIESSVTMSCLSCNALICGECSNIERNKCIICEK